MLVTSTVRSAKRPPGRPRRRGLTTTGSSPPTSRPVSTRARRRWSSAEDTTTRRPGRDPGSPLVRLRWYPRVRDQVSPCTGARRPPTWDHGRTDGPGVADDLSPCDRARPGRVPAPPTGLYGPGHDGGPRCRQGDRTVAGLDDRSSERPLEPGRRLPKLQLEQGGEPMTGGAIRKCGERRRMTRIPGPPYPTRVFAKLGGGVG
jgi:hypothetical protein